MKPLRDWRAQDRRRLIGVFTDIDDTLTTRGQISAKAFKALTELKSAGLRVVAITGRPIGWCAPFANGDAAHGIRRWPVDAIVAENGGVAFIPGKLDEIGLRPRWNVRVPLSKIYYSDPAARTANYRRMQQVVAQVLHEVPGARPARDSVGRETDIAIDHSEFSHLSPEEIARVVVILQRSGMNASVSSIHINGWFGAHNKWEGARWIVRQLLERDLDAELDQWVYVGDSTNDQIMFAHFPNSVGVANIRRFQSELTHQPRFITQRLRGAGFAEMTRAILRSRA